MKTDTEGDRRLWDRVAALLGDDRRELGSYWSSVLLADPSRLTATLARAKLAARLACRGRSVLHLGCGEGIDAPILSEQATAYLGVDEDAAAVSSAQGNWGSDRCQFACGPVTARHGQFDTVVAVVAPARSRELVAAALAQLGEHGLLIMDGAGEIGEREVHAAFHTVLKFAVDGEHIRMARPTETSGLLVACHRMTSAAAAPDRPRPPPAGCAASITLGRHLAYWFARSPRRALHYLAYYELAARVIGRPRRVLDLGCGEGLGTWLLARACGHARGVDLDEAAIAVAQRNWRGPQIDFACADAFTEPPIAMDAVTSFDLIEHIPGERVDTFWRAITTNLTAEGIAIVGTPNETGQIYASEVAKAGHVNVYSAERLEAEMRQHFRHVFMFGANDEVVHTGFAPMAHYLLAVGAQKSD